MKNCNRRYVSLILVVLGAALWACSFFGVLDDFWNGMGIGFFIVGIVQLMRQMRYKRDESYREKVDIQNTDERYRYIANKAWAWAGYLFVIIAALTVIVFKVMGKDELVSVVSGGICLILILYWGSFMFLSRKY